jgi:hypothetical protein
MDDELRETFKGLDGAISNIEHRLQPMHEGWPVDSQRAPSGRRAEAVMDYQHVDRQAEAWGRMLHPEGAVLSSEDAKKIGFIAQEKDATHQEAEGELYAVNLLLNQSIEILLKTIKQVSTCRFQS